MKKGLKIFGGVFLLLFAVLLLIPVIFKDQIKAKIDSELAKTINAEVNFEASKFSLSLIRNFPNLTIGIEDFSLIGKAEGFAGDTLFSASSMSFTADIMSVIRGDKISIKGISLNDSYILTRFTADGKSSWDIMMENGSEVDTSSDSEETSEFAIGIEKWELKNAHIVYEDASMPLYAEIKNMDHTGSGDLTQDIFDIKTLTSTPHVKVIYEGMTVMEDYAVSADVALNMNMLTSEYRFLENKFTINNFKFGFDGLIAMPDDDIRMDITYKAGETDFKDLISLIPAVYAKDYEGLETKGKLAFDGHVKGIFNDSIMPAFGLNLKVDDANMKYPDLPTAISNIVLDMKVDNKDGIIDNTVIDIKKFHMDMGNNPVDAKVLVDGLDPYKIDANILAKVNLSEISKMYPLDGLVLKGLFDLDLNANGVYSDTQWPVVDAKMSLRDGFVKTDEVPEPLDSLNMKASVSNTDGSLASTIFNLENFSMRFQNEPIEIKALVKNLDNPDYDVSLKGVIDLEKITKIYPLDDMSLAGIVKADIKTKGIMSDVEAGQYQKTATNGNMTVKNFVYESIDLPQGMKLKDASFTLTPDKMEIGKMEGFIGKSDINITGSFSNYMGYMFGTQDTILKGNMNFRSVKFDTNEWLTDEEEVSEETINSTEEEAPFEVPKNIDFVLNSSIKEVLYDNMVLADMAGNIIMRDGVLRMDKLGFNSLGGSFVANGTYNTQDLSKPLFDMDMKISNVLIKDAYQTFNTVQALAPAAEKMDGGFSTEIKMSGVLGKDMSPIMNTVNGSGMVNLANASLKGSKVMGGIAKLTSINELDPLQLKNVLINFKIVDGNLEVEPFDINAGKSKMNIGGKQSLEGILDYVVKMDIPAGSTGAAVNNAVSKLTGKPSDGSQSIKLDLGVTGTFADPKVALVSSSVKEDVKENVKKQVETRVKEQIDNSAEVQRLKEEQERMKAEKERLRKEAEEKKKAEEERLKREAEERRKAEEEKLKNKIEDKLPQGIKKPKF